MPDMNERILDCTIAGLPRGQGSMQLSRNPTTGKEFAKYPAATITHRNMAIDVLHAAYGLTRDPSDGQIGVFISARFPRPNTHYGTGRNREQLKDGAPLFMTSAPDADKIARLILDACTYAGIWHDDALVVMLTVQKIYINRPKQPSTGVSIWRIS